MNNKKGGFGAKLVLILILMLASAVGGAYGYRVLDGKLAIRDAEKAIESIKLSAYDTEEATQVQILIDDIKEKLQSATTRKDVYEITGTFQEEFSKIKTKTEKELEEARRAAEEATNNANNAPISTPPDTNNADGNTTNNSNGLFNGLFGGGNSDSAENEQGSGGSTIFN